MCFSVKTLQQGTQRGKKPLLMTAGTTNVFVYCNLFKQVMMRDVKAPLLHIVHRGTNIRLPENSVEHIAFNPAQYMPLQKKSFNTIDI